MIPKCCYVTADDYYRARFETLASTGVASRGADVPSGYGKGDPGVDRALDGIILGLAEPGAVRKRFCVPAPSGHTGTGFRRSHAPLRRHLGVREPVPAFSARDSSRA